MRREAVDTTPVLSDTMKNILPTSSKSRSLPSGLVKRTSIVLPTLQRKLSQNITPQVGLHCNNVAAWRSRFFMAFPALQRIKTDASEKLEDEIQTILSDKKCPGAPPVFMPDQTMQIINLAYSNLNSFGYEVSQWSSPLLMAGIRKQEIAE